LREATPQEAFKLKLARHLTEVGTGDANPLPFYMPIPRLPDSLHPGGDEAVRIKVKLTVKASGKVADYSFPADLSDEIKDHLQSSIKGWLFLPRIKDGKAVDQEVVLPIELN
jgi:hypothetical protein